MIMMLPTFAHNKKTVKFQLINMLFKIICREGMLFSCLVLFLFNGAFAEISKSRPNGKIDPDSTSSLKFDNNQKAKPPQHLMEEEARKVQPNIILVLVSQK